MMTQNCVHCNKPAVEWTGHVKLKEINIIAGWCAEHKYINRNLLMPACQGEFKREMKLIPSHSKIVRFEDLKPMTSAQLFRVYGFGDNERVPVTRVASPLVQGGRCTMDQFYDHLSVFPIEKPLLVAYDANFKELFVIANES